MIKNLSSFVFLIISLSLCSCSPPEATNVKRLALTNTPAVQGDGSAQLLGIINNARRQQNKPALTRSNRLTLAAKDHSVSMNQNNFFSHKGLDGKTFRTRMARRGYHRSFSAEVLAKTNHPLRAFKLWKNSKGHNKSMMNKAYTRVGIYRSGNYWTAVLASDDR